MITTPNDVVYIAKNGVHIRKPVQAKVFVAGDPDGSRVSSPIATDDHHNIAGHLSNRDHHLAMAANYEALAEFREHLQAEDDADLEEAAKLVHLLGSWSGGWDNAPDQRKQLSRTVARALRDRYRPAGAR